MDSPNQKPPLVIERFLSGIITRRSQLYPPFRAIGINIVQFHDVLIDGLNIECSDLYTLQRRPGFSPWNGVALNGGEIVNQFYSFRNLVGTVFPLMDTTTRLALIGTGGFTTWYVKNTTNQGFVSPVGNILYFTDGVDAIKYDTVNNLQSTWGIAAPTLPPSVQGFGNFWQPQQTYLPHICIQDPNGNIELAAAGSAGSISPPIPAGTGTTGSVEPVWGLIPSQTIADGSNGLTWQNIGPITQWFPNTYYPTPTVVVDSNGNLQYLYSVDAAAVATKWASGTTYAVADIVTFGGQYFISLQNANTGHTPSAGVTLALTSTTSIPWWEVTTSPTSSGAVVPVWSTSFAGNDGPPGLSVAVTKNPVVSGQTGTDWQNLGALINPNGHVGYVCYTENAGAQTISYANDFGFSIPDGANILGVGVFFTASGFNTHGAGVPSAVNVALESAAGIPIGNYKPQIIAVNSSNILGNGLDTWGASLTPAIVNSSGFGVGFQVNLTNGAWGTDVWNVYMRVWYSSFPKGNPLTNDGDYIWQNIGPGTQVVTAGYTWRSAFRTTYGHLSTSSPASINTGPVLGPVVANVVSYTIASDAVTIATNFNNFSVGEIVQITGLSTGTFLNEVPLTITSVTGVGTFAITNVSLTSNVLTITAVNSLAAGQYVTFSNVTTATFLNEISGTVLATGLSGSHFQMVLYHPDYPSAADTGTVESSNSFTATFAYPDTPTTTDTGSASIAFAVISGQGTSEPNCNYTTSLTHVNLAGNTLTITAANRLSAGCQVTFSGLSDATFLNGQQVEIVYATPTTFQAIFVPNNASLISYDSDDSGTVTFNAVEIYRIEDGGGIWYFDGAVTNPGAGNTWSYNDFVSDASLNNLVPAPIDHQNDPPPGQTGSLVTAGGTILTWWMGRNWMAQGNNLYFDGGPDVLNGNPQESWPPANVFSFPGPIESLWSTDQGLIVITADQLHVILGGPQTLTFFQDKIGDKFGVASPNCLEADGSEAALLSTQGQMFLMSSNNRQEEGQKVGDLIATNFPPPTSYITTHRNGLDSGIFLSNGTNKILRFGINTQNWSPIYVPAMGVGAIRSVETSVGIYSLLLAPPTAGGQIYYRNVSAFTDAGTTYDAYATIGSITLSEPGQPLIPLWHLLGYFVNVGQPNPLMYVLFNEISATNGATFINLPEAVNEPPIGTDPSLTLMQLRWLVNMNTEGKSLMVHHVQVKVDFGSTSTVKDELLAIALKFDSEN